MRVMVMSMVMLVEDNVNCVYIDNDGENGGMMNACPTVMLKALSFTALSTKSEACLPEVSGAPEDRTLEQPERWF